MTSNSYVTDGPATTTTNVLGTKVPNRARIAIVSFVALFIFTLAVKFEVPSDRRGNLVFLTSGLWIMWLWSLRRKGTVQSDESDLSSWF